MNRPYFSFHRLGYRRNPFGALTPAEWADVAVPAPAAAALARGRGHGQILGPAGSGKTSSLIWLQAYFAGQGERAVYEYIPEGQDWFVTDVADVAVFLLDEAQRLHGRQRRRLRRLVADGRFRLFMGAHEDMARFFGAAGVDLATVQLAEMLTLRQHEAIWARRLAYFALPGVARVTLGATAVQYLFTTFGADLRAAEYFLYEVWQRQTAVGSLSGAQLAQIRQELTG